jgi:hypothetical protein
MAVNHGRRQALAQGFLSDQAATAHADRGQIFMLDRVVEEPKGNASDLGGFTRSYATRGKLRFMFIPPSGVTQTSFFPHAKEATGTFFASSPSPTTWQPRKGGDWRSNAAMVARLQLQRRRLGRLHRAARNPFHVCIP